MELTRLQDKTEIKVIQEVDPAKVQGKTELKIHKLMQVQKAVIGEFFLV